MRLESGFQILAHLARPAAAIFSHAQTILSHVGRRATKLAAESVSEVAVAGEVELERECREITGPLLQSLEGRAETQPREVAMDGHACLPLKDPRR